MGIKYLKSYIRTNIPEAMTIKRLSDLEYSTIAVDTPCLLYKFKYSTVEKNKNWLNNILYFICKMRETNIELVFAMEGKPPLHKLETINARKTSRQNVILKLNTMLQFFEEYKQTGHISETLQTYWDTQNKKNHLGEFNEEVLEKLLSKKASYIDGVTSEDYKIFEELLMTLKIPFFKKELEAETICCELKTLQKVTEIYSCDTDVLAYKNIDRVICDIDLKTNTVSIIDKTVILKKLKFSENEFIDFCILAGTDYNKTLPRVGIVTACKLIQKYKHIDKKLDPKDSLNKKWIRSHFGFEKGIIDDYNWNKDSVNLQTLYEFLNTSEVKLHYHVEKLLNEIYNCEYINLDV